MRFPFGLRLIHEEGVGRCDVGERPNREFGGDERGGVGFTTATIDRVGAWHSKKPRPAV
jgi:hypothetical protein